jgi:transposase
MIRPGLLDSASRQDLLELARDGSAAHRLARRANALVVLDDGMNCTAIAEVLLVDDDTIRTWYALYQEDGIAGLASFGNEGIVCRLSDDQQAKLKSWIVETLPETLREIGTWIATECGIAYRGRSGLIALLHRLGMKHRKPKAVSRKFDPEKQAAVIVPSRKTRRDLAGAAGVADQAAFRPRLLPPSRPDRATMGVDAQTHHPQPVPTRGGAQAFGIYIASSYRTSFRLVRGFPDAGLSAVYNKFVLEGCSIPRLTFNSLSYETRKLHDDHATTNHCLG